MNDHTYFENLSDKEFEQLIKPFNRTLDTFNEDVTTILNWLYQQPHLPQYPLDRNIIECNLFENKCSIERTKKKIDWFFTVHPLVPEFFKNRLPWSDNLLSVQKYLYYVILPKLSKSKERIIYLKYKEVENDYLIPEFVIAAFYNSCVLSWLNDRSNGRVFIVDGKYAKLSYVKHVSPTLVKKMLTISQNAFTIKFNSLHFINTPPYFSPAIAIIKQLLSKKLRERFVFHEDNDSLIKTFTKGCLPKDCGGDLPSLDELEGKNNEEFLKQKAFFEARENWMVDESKRPQKLHSSELLGTQGNFKKLDVD